MSGIVWRNEKRAVDSLITWDINPRKISEKALEQLKESVNRFNLADPIIIDVDDTIVGGHQRLTVLKLLGRSKEKIDVRVPDRKLTDEEFRELALRLNRNQGEWDWEVLEANFNTEELLELGFEPFEFGLHNDEIEELEDDEDDDRQHVEFLAGPRVDKKNLVVFECFMTMENRDTLMKALRIAKVNYQTDKTEDALMNVVHHYLKSNE